MRVGIGYDVHPLVPERKLILGGIEVPYHKGLGGHSDADVLTHSIADALLGACGERDLGYNFPHSDPGYKDICSLHLLEKIYKILKGKGFGVVNVDSTLVAQEPRLSPYIPQMREKIAGILKIEVEQIGIKATNPEGLGFLGEKKGIACFSVVTIDKLE
jgi:2-C-methyl-D-erythritol 2,4-cyclodiphosphate synthase